jgi:ribosome-interacting GTPase 1
VLDHRLQMKQAIPGVIEYKGARIQLLDLPGIVEGASQGISSSQSLLRD